MIGQFKSTVKALIEAVSDVLSTIRFNLRVTAHPNPNRWDIYRDYEKMVGFNAEWRKRENTEAIHRESGRYGLVRIHSLSIEVSGMEFRVDRVPWPGLPIMHGWPARPSFALGSSWHYLFVGHDHWNASPYTGWMLIFDPETIELFKATAVKFQDASDEDRWKELLAVLRRWDKKLIAALPESSQDQA